jgi:hypothetical protein
LRISLRIDAVGYSPDMAKRQKRMTIISLRLPPELLQAIDRWRAAQEVPPVRQAAIRHALEKVFGKPTRRGKGS